MVPPGRVARRGARGDDRRRSTGSKRIPITAEEVERTRNQAMSGFEQQMNNSQSVAIQLSNWAAIGDWRLMFLDRDRVREVTRRPTRSAPRSTYLKSSNRTVGLFMPGEPDRAEIPRAARRHGDAAGLQGRRGARRRRGVRSDSGEHRLAHDARRAAGRHQARHAAEGDARRRRQRGDPLELRRREQLEGHRPLRGAHDADADARHARASRAKRSRTSSRGCRASSTSAAAPASLRRTSRARAQNLAAT